MADQTKDFERLALVLAANDVESAKSICRYLQDNADRFVDRLEFEQPLVEIRNGLAALELVWGAISESKHCSDEDAARALRFIQEGLERPLDNIGDITGMSS